MKVYATPDIRNVALIGHGDSGKTSLTSAFLYTAGTVKRLGKVEDGNTVTDFDEEEVERQISRQTATAHLEWKGKKVNLLDTPGYTAFVGDSKSALAVADAALVLVDAVAGVQVITRRAFRFADEYALPIAFVLNKMDRERASFDRTLAALQERFGRTAVPLQIPIGEEQEFGGLIDLISMRAHLYERDGSGKADKADVPSDLAEAAQAARSALVEMVAETDDALMEAFFESGDLDQEQLVAGLRAAVRQRRIFPVVVASASHCIGIETLLDATVDLVPAPGELGEVVGRDPADQSEIRRKVDDAEPVSLFVYKTIADPFAGRLSLFRVRTGALEGDASLLNVRSGNNERMGSPSVIQGKQLEQVASLHAGDLGVVAKLKETRTSDTLCDPAQRIEYEPIRFPAPSISYAVEPKSKGDEEKINATLQRLIEEDPVLRVERDAKTGELLVSGSGQEHVETALNLMRRKFGVEAVLNLPKVPYRETIKAKVENVEGKHKKQTGGRGQYGLCVIHMEPLPRGGGFEFVDKIFGGSIPQSYRPAVEKGIREAAERGVVSGNPLVDFRVTLVDGKYHNVDSSEMAFKIAGSLAFKEAVKRAKPTLLEPVMNVEITAPEDCMGDIMGDLSSRRGKPQGMEPMGDYQVIRAQVPMAEMLTYGQSLKSLTSDRATYHMEFDHYAEVPAQVREQIIAEAQKEKAEQS